MLWLKTIPTNLLHLIAEHVKKLCCDPTENLERFRLCHFNCFHKHEAIYYSKESGKKLNLAVVSLWKCLCEVSVGHKPCHPTSHGSWKKTIKLYYSHPCFCSQLCESKGCKKSCKDTSPLPAAATPVTLRASTAPDFQFWQGLGVLFYKDIKYTSGRR